MNINIDKLHILMRAIEHLEGFDRNGTLPQRSNNPGDLMYAGQPGAKRLTVIGRDGQMRSYAEFETLEMGLAALARQIQLDAGRGETLAAFVHRYAPGSDGNNEKSYLAGVMRALSCTDSTRTLLSVLEEGSSSPVESSPQESRT